MNKLSFFAWILFVIVSASMSDGFTFIKAPLNDNATWLIWGIVAIVTICWSAIPALKKQERKYWLRQELNKNLN